MKTPFFLMFFALASGQEPKPDPIAELAELEKTLESAKSLESKERLKVFEEKIRAFAKRHKPKTSSVEYLTKSKSTQIVIGADAVEAKPNAEEVKFSSKGSKFSIAVGGKGFDTAKGPGGKGGTVWLNSKPVSLAILLGGNGGKGADASLIQTAGKGGEGGSTWFGDHQPLCLYFPGGGGSGGKGLNSSVVRSGGEGGMGGSYGPAPPK